MTVGDKVKRRMKVYDADRSAGGKPTEITVDATVVYIHPEKRFYTLRYVLPGGSSCESYFLLERRKHMNITISGKTYQSGKITAAMTRRALELNVEALEAAAKAEDLKKSKNAETASALLELLSRNIDAKAALTCDVFGGAFDKDALLADISNTELNGLMNKIALGKD